MRGAALRLRSALPSFIHKKLLVVQGVAIRNRELLQLHQAPVTADRAPEKSLMTEMVESSLVTVALSCRIDQGEGARGAGGRRVIPVAVEEAMFPRTRYFCGEVDTDEARRCRDRE